MKYFYLILVSLIPFAMFSQNETITGTGYSNEQLPASGSIDVCIHSHYIIKPRDANTPTFQSVTGPAEYYDESNDDWKTLTAAVPLPQTGLTIRLTAANPNLVMEINSTVGGTKTYTLSGVTAAYTENVSLNTLATHIQLCDNLSSYTITPTLTGSPNSYQWYAAASPGSRYWDGTNTVTANAPGSATGLTYTINSISGDSLVYILATTTANVVLSGSNNAASCTDYSVWKFYIDEAPDLTATDIAATLGANPNNEICLYEDAGNVSSVQCTLNCSGLAYSFTTDQGSSAQTDLGGVTDHSQPTGPGYTTTINLAVDGSTTELNPGTYQISVTGTVTNGCTETVDLGELIINDKPAVVIEHDATGSFTTADNSICDTDFDLRVKNCNSATNFAIVDGSTNTTNNNTPNNDFCNDSDPTLYDMLDWKYRIFWNGALSSSISTNSSYNSNPAIAPILAQPNDTVYYYAFVTGDNGCENYDSVLITRQDPILAFQVSSTTVLSGGTINACDGDTISLNAICSTGCGSVSSITSWTDINGNYSELLDDNSTTNPTSVIVGNAANISVDGTANNGCGVSGSVTIGNISPPDLSSITTTFDCSNENTTINLGAGYNSSYSYNLYQESDPSNSYYCSGTCGQSWEVVSYQVDENIGMEFYPNQDYILEAYNSSCRSEETISGSWDQAPVIYQGFEDPYFVYSQEISLSNEPNCSNSDNFIEICDKGTKRVRLYAAYTADDLVWTMRPSSDIQQGGHNTGPVALQADVQCPDYPGTTTDNCQPTVSIQTHPTTPNNFTPPNGTELVANIDDGYIFLDSPRVVATNFFTIPLTTIDLSGGFTGGLPTFPRATTGNTNNSNTDPYNIFASPSQYYYYQPNIDHLWISGGWQVTSNVVDLVFDGKGADYVPTTLGPDGDEDINPYDKLGEIPEMTEGLVIVEAEAPNGCLDSIHFVFDINDCQDPSIQASTLTASGVEVSQDYDQQANNYSEVKYICEGNTLRLDIPSNDYMKVYWSDGSEGFQLNYATSETDNDTLNFFAYLFQWEDVSKRPTDDSTFLGIASKTVILSRGNVNLFPFGDGADGFSGTKSADSSICIGDRITFEANCPDCKKQVYYAWSFNNRYPFYNDDADFGIYDTVITLTGTSNVFYTSDIIPNSGADYTEEADGVMELVVYHGERVSGSDIPTCEDNFYREIQFDSLPDITMQYHDGTSFVDVGINNTVYLCDSATRQLKARCSTCILYDWNTGPTSSIINVNTQGGYILEGFDENGCSDTITPILVIDALEGLNSAVTAAPSVLCLNGSDVTLSVAPCIGCTYEWFDAGGSIAGTRQTTTNSVGTYYAQVTNAQGCVYPTNSLNVANSSVFIPSITSNTDSLCAGQAATLTTQFDPNFTYQWYCNFQTGSYFPISGATEHIYTTPEDSVGTYFVEVTYPNGCAEQSALKNIYQATFSPSAFASETVICSNDSVNVSTQFQSQWQYQWYQNGNAIPGAVGAAYDASIEGNYYVQVTNANLCVENTNVINVVNSTLGNFNASANKSELCEFEFGRLNVNPCLGCDYQWIGVNQGFISDATSYLYNTVNATDDYYVAVSLDGCTEYSDTVSITVNLTVTPPINSIGASPVVCEGKDATLFTARCSGCSYEWLLEDTSTGNYNLVIGSVSDTFLLIDQIYNAGSYKIAVNYPFGCSDTSLAINVIDGSDTSLLALVPSLVNEIDYSVYPPQLISTTMPDSVICNSVIDGVVGEDFTVTTLSNLSGVYNYSLFRGPNLVATNTTGIFNNVQVAGTYSVEVVNPEGCFSTTNLVPLSYVEVLPELASYASFEPDAVEAQAICTADGVAILMVENCDNCDLLWTIPGGLDFNPPGADSAGVLSINMFDSYGDGWNGAFLDIYIDNVLTYPNITFNGGNSASLVLGSLAQGQIRLELTGGAYDCEISYELILNGDVIFYDPGNYFDSYNAVACAGFPTLSPDTITFDSVIYNPPGPIHITHPGSSGTGIHYVSAVVDGCLGTTQYFVRDFSDFLNDSLNYDTVSICDGQTVMLSYEGAVNNDPDCNIISYRWLRNPNLDGSMGSPISGASNPSYAANVQGSYFLELTTDYGCVDTSDLLLVREVDPPILNFDLDSVVLGAGSGTPLAANGSPIDLSNWIFPASSQPQNIIDPALVQVYFTNSPFSGALSADAGLSNPTLNNVFTPNDSLSGFHLITYHYDSLGCSFSAEDVLEVLQPGGVVITNTNPSSVEYEACVGDTLFIQATNLEFPVDSVMVFDVDDNYIGVTLLETPNLIIDTFGVDTFYTTTIKLLVPPDAFSSYLMLLNSNNVLDTAYSPFLLIHNTDLTFSGLPEMLCSNGEPLTLFGNPQGGTFTVTNMSGTLVPAAIFGDTIYPTLLNAAAYQDGNQFVRVVYNYTEQFTNGNFCPSSDFVADTIEVKDVRLTGVDFNIISVSQVREKLTNLVKRTYPYEARANKSNYTVRFSGAFTNPAGNPLYFLPQNAGVGNHALTYIIQSGDCINQIEDSITVIDAPTALNMPSVICRDQDSLIINRDVAFTPLTTSSTPIISTYSNMPPVVFYNDAYNIMRITTTNNNEAVDTLNATTNMEEYVYYPDQVTGTYDPSSNCFRDTILIEYVFRRNEDTATVNFDTLEYVVASIKLPLCIEAIDSSVYIDSNIVSKFYCEEDRLSLLVGSPTFNSFGAGYFMLYGGNNQFASGDTLENNVINPYDVNNLETNQTTYELIYILKGEACFNSDTMPLTIGKGIEPQFFTSTGDTEFCNSDDDVLIITNAVEPDTAIWKIGGIPQADTVFSPISLAPQDHIVELEIIQENIIGVDTFYCSNSSYDTFTVFPLPLLDTTPGFVYQYCENDAEFDFIVSKNPSCFPNDYVFYDNFEGGITPGNWCLNCFATYNTIDPIIPLDAATSPNGTGGIQSQTEVPLGANPSNRWLISTAVDMVPGRTYKIEYQIMIGPYIDSCISDCYGKVDLRIGQSQDPFSLLDIVQSNPIVENDDAFETQQIIYTLSNAYDPALDVYIAFYVYSQSVTRDVYIDNIRIRDITPMVCDSNGVGYFYGVGVNNVVDSLYHFNPASVPPGIHTLNYYYTDNNMCSDSISFDIKVDSIPVATFTAMPDSICLVEADLELQGFPRPGTFSSTWLAPLNTVSNLSNTNLTNSAVMYNLNVPGLDVVEYAFTDDEGCTGYAYDTIQVVEMIDTNAFIPSLDPFGFGFCSNSDSGYVLDVIPVAGSKISDGIFYGPGVRNGAAGAGAATFHPDSAVLDMGHYGDIELWYIYLTSSGCEDTAKFFSRVHAAPDLEFANMPDSLCLNADTIQLFVRNTVYNGPTGSSVVTNTLPIQSGSFSFVDTGGTNVIGFMLPSDKLNPPAALGNDYIYVTYSFTADISYGSCVSTLYDSIRIDSVPVTYFEGLKPFYCENEDSSIVIAYPPYYVGSGYIEFINSTLDTVTYDSSFLWVEPETFVGGTAPNFATDTFSLYYTYTDTRGCTGEVYDSFEVRPYPRITLSAPPVYDSTFCRSPGDTFNLMTNIQSPIGGTFIDNRALTSIYMDSFLNLSAPAGIIELTYLYTDSNSTCTNNEIMEIALYNSPGATFDVFGGCVGMDVMFVAEATELEVGFDSITEVKWDFPGIAFSTVQADDVTIDTTYHVYNSSGTYDVMLSITNNDECVDTFVKELIISPSETLDYYESFETGPSGWIEDRPATMDTSLVVWEHTFDLFSRNIKDSGNAAWITGLDSAYNKGVRSWVYSPCFDFTTAERPMIVFDLWRDVLNNIDGMVLEYYDSSYTWQVLGNKNKGVNWYQSDFVLSRPGDQQSATYPRGWTGQSNGWDRVRYRLDQFKGQDNIRFRLAFASSDQSPNVDMGADSLDGAAFDNVYVVERTRNVLLEHFSNAEAETLSSLGDNVVDQSVYDKIFNTYNGQDVCLIQYQIDKQGLVDSTFLTNQADYGSRKYYYSIYEPFRYRLDGMTIGNAESVNINQNNLDYDMLQFPDFDIDVSIPVASSANEITVNWTIEALNELDTAEYIVHTAIVQDSGSIRYSSGASHERLSLLRKSLPNAAGESFNQPFNIGDIITGSSSWSYGSMINTDRFKPSELEAIVFVQNYETKEIYQVKTTQDLTVYSVPLEDLQGDISTEIVDVKVYPNPSSDLFTIDFGKPLKGAYQWRLVDVTGRVLIDDEVTQGTDKFTITTDNLVSGTYFFVIKNEKVYTHRKLVVLK